MNKLWGGRFDKAMAPEVERFTASIDFDCRLYAHDIRGSLAHVAMLSRARLVSRAEAAKLRAGLKRVAEEIRTGRFRPGREHEDIHMAVEARLKEIAGPVADRLHTGRSRNDQVALDLRLFLRDEIGVIMGLLRKLQRSLLRAAWKNRDTVMPGFTHLQHAQPVLIAHHLLAYVEMLERDHERMGETLARVNRMPLGSAALAGTSLPLDRERVARALGFAALCENSMDAVSDRDFALEFLAAGAIIGVHLSRMAEEIVLWASREFSFISIDLSFCSGSSLMPQKANPDVAELVRAKSGRLTGALVALLTVMKGLPLAYNRDMQEDKEPLFDAVKTLEGCLEIMAGLWEKITFRADTLGASLRGDFSQATSLAEYLVTKGLPFREAHRLVGRMVAERARRGRGIEELRLEELRRFSPLFSEDALSLLAPGAGVAMKKSSGSTAPAEVKKALASWSRRLRVRHA